MFGGQTKQAFKLLDDGSRVAVYLEMRGVKSRYMVVREDVLRNLLDKAGVDINEVG